MSNNNPSHKPLGDLIDDAVNKRLIIRPVFQRRQVWNNTDKENFIDTILKGLPFPEIFVAAGKREPDSTRREKVLVDGQQRLSTVLAYMEGSDTLLYRKIPRYSDLEKEQRDAFFDYPVAVRDLGTATEEKIKEIFSRINSTDYALKSMELLNAMFNGAYKQFCEQLSRDEFFENHKVFTVYHKKRMYDVTFCVILVTTFVSGYYKRDERNKEYLHRYNESFPQTDEVRAGLDVVFDFTERCRFPDKSRAWKQTDLFTLLVEFHRALVGDKLKLDPTIVGSHIQEFYEKVDDLYKNKKVPDESEVPAGAQTVFTYLKAASKASNDKYSRVERAKVISEILRAEMPRPAPSKEKAATTGTKKKPRRNTTLE